MAQPCLTCNAVDPSWLALESCAAASVAPVFGLPPVFMAASSDLTKLRAASKETIWRVKLAADPDSAVRRIRQLSGGRGSVGVEWLHGPVSGHVGALDCRANLSPNSARIVIATSKNLSRGIPGLRFRHRRCPLSAEVEHEKIIKLN